MFVLKIFAISLTFYINVRAELCDPNQVVEFSCKDSLCAIESPEIKFMSLRTKKHISNVVGYNQNSYLLKTKNNFDIIPTNDFKVYSFSKHGFNYTVKINKDTRNICEYKDQNNNNRTQSDTVNNSTSQTIGTNVADESKNPIKKLNSINTPSEHTDKISITSTTKVSTEDDTKKTENTNLSSVNINNEVHNINTFEENEADDPNKSLNNSKTKNVNVGHSLDDTLITTDDLNISTIKNIAAVVKKNVPSESVSVSEEKNVDNQPTFSPLEAQKEIPEDSDSVDDNDNENEQDLNSLIPDGKDGPETTDPLELHDKSTLETSENKECPLGDCSNKIGKTIPIEGKDGNQQVKSNPSMNVAARVPDVLTVTNPENPNTTSFNETDLNEEQNENIASTTTLDVSNTAKLEKSSTNSQSEIVSINEQNGGNIIPETIDTTSQNKIFSTDKPSDSNTLPQANDTTITEGTNTDNVEKPNTTNYNENQLQENTNNSNEKLDDKLTNDVLFDTQTAKIKEPEQIGIKKNQNTSLDSNSTQTYNTSDEINKTNDSLATKPLIEKNKKDYASPNQNFLNSPVIMEMENIGEVENKDRKTPVVDVPAECSSVTDCPHSTVSQNGHSSSYQYEHQAMKNAVEPELIVKNIDRGSFVSSFGHPDSCSGVSCMSNKVIKQDVKTVAQTAPTSGQENSVYDKDTAHTIEMEEKEDMAKNEIIETHTDEWKFLDYIQQWLSSPTINTVEFISNIFSNSYSFNDNQIEIFSCDGFGNKENLKHRNQMNDNLKTYFTVAAVVTLLFFVGYCKYQKGAYENHLLTLLAVKEQNLLIAENELCILKEQNTEGTTIAVEKNAEFDELRDQLAKSEDIISSQWVKIEKLEQEVEELTESGIEMHSLLSSALESSTKNNDNLQTVKAKLVESENLITALTQKNFEKTMELEKKYEVIKNYQVSTDELTQKNSQLFKENEKLTSELEQILAKNMLKESKMIKQMKSLEFELDKKNSALITAETEVTLSKNSLEDMLSQKFNLADAKKMMNSIKATAELKSAKHMCEQYKCKLEEYAQSNQQFTDYIDTLKTEITNIKASYSKLNKTNDELENKLDILTKFFKDQEKEYQRQINEKSLLYNNKEGESANLNEQLEFLNQEISNYKSEIQSLKKEITDQEASFKIQLSAVEKKASDYWISFRQAERKLKEMELESAQLRNKLTMSDKKHENGTTSIDSSKDFEDELLDIPLPTVSPEFTLLDFEPPPPLIPSSLHLASTDQRLPPLGALGQASTSPIPLSRRINRSMSPVSPPPPHLMQRSSAFRPLPHRYNYMDRQNSLGHSVESLDK